MLGNDLFYTHGYVSRDNTLPICLVDQDNFTQISIGLTKGGTVFPNFHRWLVIAPFHTLLHFLLQVQRWWIDFFLLFLKFCQLNIFCFFENQSIRCRQIICVPRPVHCRLYVTMFYWKLEGWGRDWLQKNSACWVERLNTFAVYIW